MNVTCRIILCFSWKRVIFGWFWMYSTILFMTPCHMILTF
jgi:hypothetical protein